MVVPTMELRVPDGRSLDVFLDGPQPEHGHLTLAIDSIPRIVDELVSMDR